MTVNLPPAASDALDWIRVAADPAKAEARLREITEKHAAVTAMFDDLRREQGALQRNRTEWSAEHTASVADLANRSANAVERERVVTSRETAVDKRVSAAVAKERVLSEFADTLANKSRNLQLREEKLADAEAYAARVVQEHTALNKKLKERLAALDAAMKDA